MGPGLAGEAGDVLRWKITPERRVFLVVHGLDVQEAAGGLDLVGTGKPLKVLEREREVPGSSCLPHPGLGSSAFSPVPAPRLGSAPAGETGPSWGGCCGGAPPGLLSTFQAVINCTVTGSNCLPPASTPEMMGCTWKKVYSENTS